MRKTSDFCQNLQQDGAPSHAAEENQEWLREQGVDFIELKNRRKCSAFRDQWPSSSYDIALCDTDVNPRMKALVAKTASSSIEQLERKITWCWERLPQKFFRRVADRWLKLLRASATAAGHICSMRLLLYCTPGTSLSTSAPDTTVSRSPPATKHCATLIPRNRK